MFVGNLFKLYNFRDLHFKTVVGSKVRKVTEQSSSVSDCSTPASLTCRKITEEVAVQSRSKSCVEKSLTRTVKTDEKQSRSSTGDRHKDLFVRGETRLEDSNHHQEENIYRMKFQESQQKNKTFSTIETSPCSSMVSECFIIEDENERSPIVEIASQKEAQTCSGNIRMQITCIPLFHQELIIALSLGALHRVF